MRVIFCEQIFSPTFYSSLQKRQKRFLRGVERWIGDFHKGQAELLIRDNELYATQTLLRFECREQREKKLIQLLKNKAPKKEVQELMYKWWTMTGCGAKTDQTRKWVRQTMIQQFDSLEKTLNNEQWASLVERMSDINDQIKSITNP